MRTLLATLLREVNAGPTYGADDAAQIDARRTALAQSGLPAVVEAAPYLARYDPEAGYDYTMNRAVDAALTRVRVGIVSR
ncbi:hypothetical protein [Nocardia sp. NPDC057455]|uniref:hypothetical protein n=1 Tax=Nocardia sp. NPDC057455 TaxID=3346138 RepID=UPI00366D75F2